MPFISAKPNKAAPSVRMKEFRDTRNFQPWKSSPKSYIHFRISKNTISGLRAFNDIHEGRPTPWLHIHRAQKEEDASTSSISCGVRDSGVEVSCSESESGFKGDRGGLLKNASTIGMATIASKILGLLRETVLAAAFGIGPVITAFNYASILPSFFISLLGGINGPLHMTITSALSKRSNEDGQRLIEKINATVFLASAVSSITVFIFAKTIIELAAPGLLGSGKYGHLIRDMATIQLKIMSPCILFSGPLAVGFGCLNAVGIYHIPSLSPALSSMAIIFAIAVYIFSCKFSGCAPQTSFFGAVLLASAASVGAFIQWLVQAIAEQKAGFSVLSMVWTNPLMDTDMREVFAVIVPAILGSGMLQIATFTDLYFASFIPGAAASISYANLLAMAPLGIISSSMLLPLLPVLSQLSKPSLWPRMKDQVKQGVLLCMAVTLPLTAVVPVLAKPIVEVVFQRFAFDMYATASVSTLLVCYILGSPFYLVRDLLIRVFYAFDDGQSPFLISLAAIIMNAFLDWLFISKMGFGVEGLVIATSLVNIFAVIILLLLLSNKIGGLNFKEWMKPCVFLIANCVCSTIFTLLVFKGIRLFFSCTIRTRMYWISEMLTILLSSSMGLLAFSFPLWCLQIEGLQLAKILHQKD